jgi:dihydroorotase
MADLGSMHAAGIRFFSDDGDSVPEAGLMRRIMLTAASLPGAVVAQHAEDRSLSGDGHLHEGTMSALHGIAGIPSAAEDVIVARDLVLAAETGARVHIQHVSTATSVVMIEQAKAAGTPVTAEVTPHHLVLDDSALDDLDPMLKMYPPLRDAADRDSVVSALLRGVIDAVATDHAPHTFEEKAVPFEEAPRGVIGLETAASIASVALQGDQRMFFARLSVEPARIAGLSRQGIAVEPGAPANLVVFDPGRSWTVDGFESRSGNSPFLGETLKGRVMATINEGRITYEGGL